MNDYETSGAASRQDKVSLQDIFSMGLLEVLFFYCNTSYYLMMNTKVTNDLDKVNTH